MDIRIMLAVQRLTSAYLKEELQLLRIILLKKVLVPIVSQLQDMA